ncbi:unconventional myosin-XVIIIa-like isoform X2 [Convolutriloba macropyga]|uniref:unconventional myosin-XVIIIa-like isoform X2 n=1 Tax=Convolutriloba macropyga TaxID=536237 RepID=UPI003F521AB7
MKSIFKESKMFKSKKRKDENAKMSSASKAGDEGENNENAEGSNSDLFKFSMNKRVSIEKPSTADAPDAKQAVAALSPSQQKSSKSKSSTSSSKIRKSILKNNPTSPLLTSPQENVELEFKEPKSDGKTMRFVGSGDVLDSAKANEAAPKRRESNSKLRRSLNLTIPKIPVVTHKSFDENLLLPKIYSTKSPEPRELVLKQNFAGDYGFTVKTSTLLEKVPLTGEIIERNIHFAESSANSTQTTGLLPGDKLLRINDTPVESLPKEQLLELIKAAKTPEIKITVQPVPELLELCQRCGLEDYSSLQAITDRNFDKKSATTGKFDDALKSDNQYSLTPSHWLVHAEGYSGCTLVSEKDQIGGGHTKVKLTESGSSLVVDEADLEKCNPPDLDTVEDICKLRYMNESSILHVLRTRYSGSELFHTFCGYNLMVINPAHATSAYNDKAMTVLKKCASKEEMPPHIFSLAQLAYRRMIATRRDQSVVFLGQSGSGKSVNLNHVLKYLAANAGSTNNLVTTDKMLASQTILSSFGSCRTSVNGNGSKFTQIISIEFDYAGTISGASIQGILLEKSRLTNFAERRKGESTFNVFAQLVYGCSEEEGNLWSLPKTFPDSGEKGGVETYFSHKGEVTVLGARGLSSHVYTFKRLKSAFEVLSVSKAEQDAIFRVVAAIFHILLSGSVKSGNKYEFADQERAEKAAGLLGVKLQTLTRATFYGNVTGVGSSALNARAGRGMRGNAGANIDLSGLTSRDMLEGMAMGMYQDLFNVVLSLINRALTANYKSNIAMQIIDAPGLIKNSYEENDKGNSLEELFVNYTHERLHQLFHDSTVANPLKLFEQERIDVDFEDSMPTDPSLIIDMLDQSPVKKLTKDDEEVEVKGLLWVLDEESIFPDSTCEMMLNKVTSIYGDRSDGLMTRKGTSLTIRHCQGSSPVTYNAENWLQRCKENPVCRMSLPLLQESANTAVAEVFARLRSYVSGTVAGTITGDALNLRRQTQVRRGFSSIATVKKNSLSLQVKFQLDFVLGLLRHTQMNFVLCLQPNLKSAGDVGSYSSIDVPFLRAQVQAAQIVSAARMFRVGYPDSVNFDTFIRSYSMLVPADSFTLNPLDERVTCESLCNALEVPPGSYALGVTKLFFRCGVVSDLDERRDEKISAVIVDFQAYCRGYVAKKQLQKLQLQNRAVACIQKNIKLFFKVRQWDWWKLYIRVLPLARVNLSEEERRAKVANLEEATRKLEQRDEERQQLTSQVSRLECEVEELGVQLTEEQAGLQHTTQLYEQELLNRRSLEEQVRSLKLQLASSEKQNSKMEVELNGLRQMANSSMLLNSSGIGDDREEDDFLDEAMFKSKLVQIKKQQEIDKKRLEGEMEEERVEWEKAKKGMERRLNEMREDVEDRDHTVQQLKRKAAKIQEELQDTNLLLNQQMSRNTELERKQRKFDGELTQVQQLTAIERQAKEKLSSEKEHLVGENYILSREKEELSENLENAESKIKRLQSEIDDLTENQTQASEVTVLKRDKHMLQSKLKEQEEELDELAGEVSRLEAAKLRLEMEMGKVRNELTKELEIREDEFEQNKQSYLKRIRGLETQLDDEIHERQIINREKLELERKLKSLASSKNSGDIERERKLQKQLMHARNQLAEIQTMLDGMSEQCTTAKRENRSLKHQLEEARDSAESAKASRDSLQRELQDTIQELDQWKSQYYTMEDKLSKMSADKSELETQLEEAEEDMVGLEKKLRNIIAEAAIDRNAISSLTNELADVRRTLIDKEEQLAGLQAKYTQVQSTTVDKALLTKAESKVAELDRALGVEKSLKQKNDNQVNRLKAQSEKHNEDLDALTSAQKQKDEQIKKLNSQLRDVKDDLMALESRFEQSQSKKHDLERQLADMEDVNGSVKQELNVANQRIALLQRSLQDMNSSAHLNNSHSSQSYYLSDEDEEDGEGGSLNSDEDDDVNRSSNALVLNSTRSISSEDEDYGSAAAELSSTADA